MYLAEILLERAGNISINLEIDCGRYIGFYVDSFTKILGALISRLIGSEFASQTPNELLEPFHAAIHSSSDQPVLLGSF